MFEKRGVDSNCCLMLERTVYNYAVRRATEKRLVRSWKNTKFVLMYKNRLRSVLRNIESTALQQQIKDRAWKVIADMHST